MQNMYLRQQKDVLQMNKLMSGAEAVLQALLDEEVAHVHKMITN